MIWSQISAIQPHPKRAACPNGGGRQEPAFWVLRSWNVGDDFIRGELGFPTVFAFREAVMVDSRHPNITSQRRLGITSQIAARPHGASGWSSLGTEVGNNL